MGKRKQESVVDVLVRLPWQMTIGLGVIVFIALHWLIPALFAGNPILVGLAIVSFSLSWFALIIFCFLGLIAFLRAGVATSAAIFPKSGRAASQNRFGRTARIPSKNISAGGGLSAGLCAEEGGNEQPSQQHAAARSEFASWTLESLRALEWKRFEYLCAHYYEAVGFKSKTLRCGADGGIDVKLYKIDPAKPLAVVQCKAWNSQVGVKEVRELLGVMVHEKVGRGIFITTSTFTKDAQAFGAANPLQLLDGADFVQKIQELPPASRDALFDKAFAGDFRTPSCASCGIKMVSREGKGKAFWGCANFPRCRTTFPIKS